ncbi:MAG: helix-turn-helix domain-containing protein [Pseudomonadota bacterium]|nr:helix-turn-helix domain-containing protein [Pseudomonadota bacterium]
MARPLRIEYPNAYYHVSNRAEGAHKLFPGDQYFQIFLAGVFEAAARLNVEVHCWSLLKNEYHLLVKTPEGNLSRFMRQVDGLYTQNYQRLKKSKGSIFRSRYKSVLFQPERYLLALSRYLHRLPARYSSWRWSSLPAYTGGKTAGSVGAASVQSALVRNEVLAQVGGAAARYAAYVAEGGDPELQRFYSKKNQLSILGDERFRSRARAALSPTETRGASKGALAKKRPGLQKIVALVAETFDVTPKSILQAARGPGSKNIPRWVAMYLCQEAGGITLQVIAQHFGLQRYGTVSTTIGKLKQEVLDAPKLQQTIQKLRKQLTES